MREGLASSSASCFIWMARCAGLFRFELFLLEISSCRPVARNGAPEVSSLDDLPTVEDPAPGAGFRSKAMLAGVGRRVSTKVGRTAAMTSGMSSGARASMCAHAVRVRRDDTRACWAQRSLNVMRPLERPNPTCRFESLARSIRDVPPAH